MQHTSYLDIVLDTNLRLVYSISPTDAAMTGKRDARHIAV
jgi:hypothetical protein